MIINNPPATSSGGVGDTIPLGTSETAGTNLFIDTSPTTPTGGVVIYAVKRANRRMLGWKTPTGRTERFSPWLGSNNRYEYSAVVNATTYSTYGCPTFTVGQAAVQAALTNTNFLTTQKRNQQTLATAAAILSQTSPQFMAFRAPGNGGGGFHMCWRFGIVALPTDGKLFCGMTGHATTPQTATNVNPSTLLNCIGLAKDSSATTTLKFLMGGSTANSISGTLTNTGTMTGIANTFWQVEIFCKAADTGFGWRVTRTSSTGVETVDEGTSTGTAGTQMPADNMPLAPMLYMANTSAVTITMNFSQFFLETD